MVSIIENNGQNITPDRFFPAKNNVEPQQLIFSFQLFLEITQTFSGFGTNFHYSFEQNAINMKFDLHNGGTLGLYVNKDAHETFVVIHKQAAVVHTEQIGEIVDMNLGPDKKTLLFTSKNGAVHTVDQLGRVTSDFSNYASAPLAIQLADIVESMGRAKEREEQLAETRPYDPRGIVNRTTPLEIVGWMFENARVGSDSLETVLSSAPFTEISPAFSSDEEKTKPVFAVLDGTESTALTPITSESLKANPAPSVPVSNDSVIKFKDGTPVPAEAKVTGGWHLPKPIIKPAQISAENA